MRGGGVWWKGGGRSPRKPTFLEHGTAFGKVQCVPALKASCGVGPITLRGVGILHALCARKQSYDKVMTFAQGLSLIHTQA